MIKFYKIRNINEENIPWFTNADGGISSVYAYLEERIAYTYNDNQAYYPSFYLNTIKIDTTDIPLFKEAVYPITDTAINYICITNDGVSAYYFIDNFEYISENVYKLHIHMDTILTFYKNIFVTDAIVERAMIDRWLSSDTINREYVRENFSSGDFRRESVIKINNTDNYVVVVRLSPNASIEGSMSYYSYPNVTVDGITYTFDTNDRLVYQEPAVIRKTGEDTTIIQSGKYLVFPLPSLATTYNASDGSSHYKCIYKPWRIYITGYGTSYYSIDSSDIVDLLDRLLKSEEVVKMSIVPATAFSNYFTITRGTEYDYVVLKPYYYQVVVNGSTYNYWSTAFVPRPYGTSGVAYGNNGPFVGVLKYPIDLSVTTGEITLFTRNTNPNYGGPPYTFEPVLMDDNYVQVKFGTAFSKTTIPLYLSDTATFDYQYTYDMGENMFISASPLGFHSLSNEFYPNVMTIQLMSDFDLVTDYYNEYVSRNKYTMRATALTGIAKSSLALTSSAYNVYSDYVNEKTDDMVKDVFSGIKQVGKSLDPIKNELLHRANLQATPQDIHNEIDYSTNYLADNYSLYLEKYVVSDINKCANIYRRYGYKVDNYVNYEALSGLFTNYNNRSIFNYIKFSQCNIRFNNMMNSIDIANDVKRRLLQGIRYWKLALNQGDSSYIENRDMYDNIENSLL